MLRQSLADMLHPKDMLSSKCLLDDEVPPHSLTNPPLPTALKSLSSSLSAISSLLPFLPSPHLLHLC